jgi:hypothetical protein
MKLELLIFGITGLLVYNAYYDGKYTKYLMSWKKYIQIATIALIGLSLYLLVKRNPLKSKNLLLYANNAIKYMPIDKSSMDLISPIFDLTNSNKSFMEHFQPDETNAEKRILNSGQRGFGNGNTSTTTKRSVSETKKKYVASNQDWKCKECTNKLNAWFEVDHKVRLEYGGGNDVTNLVALCRECHGKKTAMENM